MSQVNHFGAYSPSRLTTFSSAPTIVAEIEGIMVADGHIYGRFNLNAGLEVADHGIYSCKRL